MSGKEIEISGEGAANAITYAQQIENSVKDSLQQAKDLQATVTSSHWKGKTRDAFLSYLELIIQLNADMADALEDHTKALKDLDKHIHTFSNTSEVQTIKNL
ncbi:WXG100 family type VII secretion target [Bacillus sp. 3103sda1]|uniref:WXG100 family type VII secretion target n=1 Tax=unclassified Bacillus (in: firmicutes) TaxID=185979 RepID=UPI00209C7448|nr:WXG100 family type VII secretion target [Bacillus sp. 3103sda1]MCP1122580.1 WXG100 family type VII secretion target [Bacillus sp. 3103sda1]